MDIALLMLITLFSSLFEENIILESQKIHLYFSNAEAAARDVCKKRCSQKSHKIHSKTPMPETNKIAGLRPAALLKKRLWHRCFPVNFVKCLRTSYLQNTSGRLLLPIRLVKIIKLFPSQFFLFAACLLSYKKG